MIHPPYLAILAICLASQLAGRAELLFPNSDFESGSLSNWTASGAAFTRQPTLGDNTSARGNVSCQKQGNYWIGTFENYDGINGNPGDTRGDGPVGSLTSREFTITKRYITFRMGGGNLPNQAGAKLVCDGVDHFMGTGLNTEAMLAVSFDARDLVGKSAHIVIQDQATGGWGHINADDFQASDEPAASGDGNFQLLPGIPPADSPLVGYGQPLRPQFHFTSRRNWLNDPNGMVFDGKNYHLFFQHNPLGTGWGNMSWGHAISPDMVHWRQVGHALLPYQVDGRAGAVYSGTAVVDHNNSLGLQVGDRRTLAAVFTHATEPFYQAMASSTDGGVTWNYRNQGRAVVPNQGFDAGERDPKVFWHEATQRWVMVLWVQNNPGRIRFLTSTDLTNWTFASDLLRDWAFECMDMFPLPVDGDPAQTKWVIYDASFDYEIGTFDGTTFHTESGPFHAGHGNFYAAQSFNQAPAGRVVQIGWMNGGPDSAAAYGLPFNQQMSFPCDLTLRTTPAGVRLCAYPIPEIGTLTTATHGITARALTPADNLLDGMGPLDLVDLSLDFDPGTASRVILELPGTTVSYDVASGIFTHTGTDGNFTTTLEAPQFPRGGHVKLRLLLDRLSLEAYAFDGEGFGSHYVNPNNGSAVPSLRSEGGNAFVHSLTVKSLGSIWTAETPLATSLLNSGFEEGLPAAKTFDPVVPHWTTFGDWEGAAGRLDDTGDALTQAMGYPGFTGSGAASLRARNAGSEIDAGLFQSLGHVATSDVGKTFSLAAALGARIPVGPGTPAHTGQMTVSFRKGVNPGIHGSKGTLLGAAGERIITADNADLPSLASVSLVRKQATFTPGIDDVGSEIFAVIDLHHQSGNATATDEVKEYLADNVTLGAKSPAVPAGPLAYEGFDYAAGTGGLAGQDGGTGWAAGWQTITSGSADILAGSLMVGGVGSQYNGKSIGNRANLQNGRRVGRPLDTSANGTFGAGGYLDESGRIGADGTSVYVSFLQQPDGSGLFYEFEIHRDNLGDPGRIAGIGNDKAGDNVNFRAPDGLQSVIGAGNTSVNLYIIRIEFKKGADDVYIYRNPQTADQPSSATFTRLAAGDMSFNGISFGAFVNGRTVAHDEVRIGRSWAEAIGIGVFEEWGDSAGLDDSPGKDSAFAADPDQDGIPNGLEWMLGGNPLARDSGELLTMESTDGLVLRFGCDLNSLRSSDLTVQWTPDPGGGWNDVKVDSSGGVSPEGIVVTVDQESGPALVNIRIPSVIVPDGKVFARLRAAMK